MSDSVDHRIELEGTEADGEEFGASPAEVRRLLELLPRDKMEEVLLQAYVPPRRTTAVQCCGLYCYACGWRRARA